MKQLIFSIVGLFLMSGVLKAQTDSTEVSVSDSIQLEINEALTKLAESICENPDVMPEFPGGPDALRKYINQNVQYPRLAAENKEQGRVFVKYIVEPDGTISSVEVARSVSRSLDNEAIRVVKNMPKWKPGTKNGIPVRVAYAVPINFQLQ